jgi:hypothetical protein
MQLATCTTADLVPNNQNGLIDRRHRLFQAKIRGIAGPQKIGREDIVVFKDLDRTNEKEKKPGKTGLLCISN